MRVFENNLNTVMMQVVDEHEYNHDIDHAELSNLAVSPLTIPLIAGPGAMVTIIHYAHTMALTAWNVIGVIGVCLLLSAVISCCLYATTQGAVARILKKKSVIGVITRLCGLLIIAISAQMLLGAVKLYLG